MLVSALLLLYICELNCCSWSWCCSSSFIIPSWNYEQSVVQVLLMAHFEVSGHSDRQTASPPTNAGTGFTGFLSLLLQKFPSNPFNGIAGLLDGWLDDVFHGGAVGPVRKSEWISCWRASSSSFWLLLTVPKKRQTAKRSRAQKEGKSALQPFRRPSNVYQPSHRWWFFVVASAEDVDGTLDSSQLLVQYNNRNICE